MKKLKLMDITMIAALAVLLILGVKIATDPDKPEIFGGKQSDIITQGG